MNQSEITELRKATLVKLPAQEETIKDLENRLNDMQYDLQVNNAE